MHWIEYIASSIGSGMIAFWAIWFPDMQRVVQDEPQNWQLTLDPIEDFPPSRPPTPALSERGGVIFYTVVDSEDDVGEYGYESDFEDLENYGKAEERR